jgi:hypothetical protein
VLRTFDSRRRSVLTTDASAVAISAVLTQPDDDGVHHPVAYESRKLTLTEQAYPAHVLELLAVVHALRVFRHYLLGSGAPRPPGARSDFTLRTDNQAVTWLRTKREVNRFLARWLDEIEEFRFDVEHVPGRLNPADPLSRRGLPAPVRHGSRAAAIDGSAPAEDPARPDDVVGSPGAASRQPRTGLRAFSGARVQLLTGEYTVPADQSQPERHFLAPDFIAAWKEAMPTDQFFAPILKGAAVTVGGMVDRTGQPVTPQAARPAGGAFLTAGGQASRYFGVWGLPPACRCDPIDFNGNGVFPEDQDIIDFLLVLAGGPCSPGNICNDIDFNNNTVYPEDQDVIDFFTVLAGGQCP